MMTLQLDFFYLFFFIRASYIICVVLHSSSYGYSFFWSNPFSSCSKASLVGSLHERVASQSWSCKDFWVMTFFLYELLWAFWSIFRDLIVVFMVVTSACAVHVQLIKKLFICICGDECMCTGMCLWMCTARCVCSRCMCSCTFVTLFVVVNICQGVNLLSKFHLSSSYSLGVKVFWRYFHKRSLTLIINQPQRSL